MLHYIVRCAHCGQQYTLQVSGKDDGTNSTCSEDYCPDCYALIKDELNALRKKLYSKEVWARHGRFCHAYVEVDDVTIEQCKEYWDKSHYHGEVFLQGCVRDDWGYIVIPFRDNLYYRDGKLHRKVLVDTVKNEVLTDRFSGPWRYQERMCRCTSISKEMYDKWKKRFE